MKQLSSFFIVFALLFSILLCAAAEAAPATDLNALQTAVEFFLQEEMKKQSISTENDWERFIFMRGVSMVSFDPGAVNITREKTVPVSFLVASGQPDIKKQPEYENEPTSWLEGVSKSINELDTSVRIRLLIALENGQFRINYAKGAEAALVKTVERLANRASKAFTDKTLLTALVDYLMPAPYLLGSKVPESYKNLKHNPAFFSFLARNGLADDQDDNFISHTLLLGIKGHKLDVSAGPEKAILTFSVPHLNDRISAEIPSLCQTLAYTSGIKTFSAPLLNHRIREHIKNIILPYRYEKSGDQAESIMFSLFALPGYIHPADYYTHEQNGIVTDPAFYDKELTDYVAILPDYPPEPFPKSGLIDGTSDGEQVKFVSPNDGYSRCINIYRVDDDVLEAMVFIKTESASIRLPEGLYYMEVGIGDIWYGNQNRFGSNGVYYKSDPFEIFDYTNHTYELPFTYLEARELYF